MATDKATKPKPRGRPPENKETWNIILRLPKATGSRIRSAARKNCVSINTAIETILEVYLQESGF